MKRSHLSTSAAETKRIGRIAAEELLKSALAKPRSRASTLPGRRAAVFALIGELGSGKTTFLQGFGKGLGIKRTLPSPTFLLARAYPVRRKFTLYHIDCYRIKSSRDILDLGFRDWISHPDHIVVIEWADRIRRMLPKNSAWIIFSHGRKKNERSIDIKN